MAVLVAHTANSGAMWPCFVNNFPAQGNLSSYSVELVLNKFVEEHPTVNLFLFVATEYPVVNVASNPEVWARTESVTPHAPQFKVSATLPALESSSPGGQSLANGVQVVHSVPFDTQARKYPLLPENVAL